MSKRQTSQLLTAPAGTGKSYMVTYDLVERWLPERCTPEKNGDRRPGRVITNMPFGTIPEHHKYPPRRLKGRGGEAKIDPDDRFFVQRIGDYVAKRNGHASEEVQSRIELIPEEVLRRWADNSLCSGPWEDYDGDISGCHFVIDEAHVYASDLCSKEKKKAWQQFCGELRHRGATVQFVTQSPGKLAREVQDECGIRQALIDAEEERDPFLRIKLYYWYQLRAKLLGRYVSSFVRLDFRDIDGKKSKVSATKWVTRSQSIFRLYDSHSAPLSGVGAGSVAEVQPWERMSWPRLLLWFVWSNLEDMAMPFAKLCGVVLFLFFVRYGMGSIAGIAASMSGTAGSQVTADIDPVVSAPPPPSVTSPRVAELPSTAPIEQLPMPAEVESEEPAEQGSGLFASARVPAVEQSVLSYLSRDVAAFDDGIPYEVGDSILVGELKGDVIEEIDFDSRSVVTRIRGRMFVGKATQPGSRIDQDIPPELLDGKLPDSLEIARFNAIEAHNDRVRESAPELIRSPIGNPLRDQRGSRPIDRSGAGDARSGGSFYR
ncbi:MAG: zonular occludens toxin domain-containing protein [Planctomycetota bacterium]